MPKYGVTMIVDATTYVVVEAKNKKEAEKKAWDKAYVSVCHQCADHIDIGDITEISEIIELDDDAERALK